MRRRGRSTSAAVALALAALTACGDDSGEGATEGDSPPPEAVEAPTDPAPAVEVPDCAGSASVRLDADDPVDETFDGVPGGSWIDPDGRLHLVVGDGPVPLAGRSDGVVVLSVEVPLEGSEVEERTYTAAGDGARVIIGRDGGPGRVSGHFGGGANDDVVELTVTAVGDGTICATLTAESTGLTPLTVEAELGTPFGEFEDQI